MCSAPTVLGRGFRVFDCSPTAAKCRHERACCQRFQPQAFQPRRELPWESLRELRPPQNSFALLNERQPKFDLQAQVTQYNAFAQDLQAIRTKVSSIERDADEHQ
jgi:hypothetical protein